MPVNFHDLESLTSSIRSGRTTARAAVEFSINAADRLNQQLNAFLEIDRTGALRRADEIDKNRKQVSTEKASSVLTGIPIALKDNICVRGLQTSCGSKILGDYHPPYNATVTERLLQAGAVIVGKTNCDEFAMGSSNENSAFGVVRNPWDVTRVPGGSSGGSAAAVAASIVPAALGSDTGGSVRQPASLCGVVGLKPTYGRNSRYGLVAFASSLDQIGVFARRARDVAQILGVIAGRDVNDATTADVPVPDYVALLDGDSGGEFAVRLTGARIGFPPALFGAGLDEEIASSVKAVVEVYRSLGAEIVEVELPNASYAIATYYIIATAEASSNLARFDGVRYGFRAEEAPELRQMYRRTRAEGFGAEVKRRIMLGTYVLSAGYYDAYYRKAQQVRTLIKEDFRKAFESCDAIITPTSPTAAFAIGEKVDDPLAMYLNDIYTVTANLAGVPGISVPCGLTSTRLPIGFQLLGTYWSEPTLFKLSHAYEQASPFTERPPVSA
jgi:aspartyl-tRNA(Asn)/glutamyl-tRNA(Gln) amidotransferase subunit A